MIKAEIVLDSISHTGVRLTTFSLTYPRFIHSEFMTHRMLSRNASSSRAIPVSKFMDAIKNEPAMPTSFSKNCKGMQAQEDIQDQGEAQKIWLEARDAMIEYVQKLSDLGVHKQHANRLLEPFQHINVVCTATDYANFFALRTHKDAQPEFRELAEKMYEAYSKSEPDQLVEGEWHLPYVTLRDNNKIISGTPRLNHSDLVKISVARCARVSYLTHEGTQPSIEKDLELYDRLVGSVPLHASPTEHQAVASDDPDKYYGNFRGWIQYRKTLANENVSTFKKG